MNQPIDNLIIHTLERLMAGNRYHLLTANSLSADILSAVPFPYAPFIEEVANPVAVGRWLVAHVGVIGEWKLGRATGPRGGNVSTTRSYMLTREKQSH